MVRVRTAVEGDVEAILVLAAQVEELFGPMVDELGFHAALTRNVRRGTALVALGAQAGRLPGAVLFSTGHAPGYGISWLVVDEAERGSGVGRALVAGAFQRFVHPPATIEVTTFGADHPGAAHRGFYERLGFVPAEAAPDGPEGGSRQVFRLGLEVMPEWARLAISGDGTPTALL